MAKRVDEREPTQTSLEVYDNCLKLSDHILSVCKPKEKNINNKHIPKRNLGLGRMLTELVVDLGADIIEANTTYVGVNLNVEDRKKNYRKRIGLQEHAKSTTYRMEHIIRVLHFNAPFADSTITYMMQLLVETRQLLIGWKEKDMREAKSL